MVDLTEANFKALVMESTDLWLVEFYAPWYVQVHVRAALGSKEGDIRLTVGLHGGYIRVTLVVFEDYQT